MLTNILSRDTCASCRVCCAFDSDDIWEAPVIASELKSKIQNRFPGQELVPFKDSFLLKMEASQDGLYYCPMLSEKGCVLGDEKPFDCKIWPFRVMNFMGTRVITISPVCSSLFAKPLNELTAFVQGDFVRRIFAEADSCPDIAKEYIRGYPILAVQ